METVNVSRYEAATLGEATVLQKESQDRPTVLKTTAESGMMTIRLR